MIPSDHFVRFYNEVFKFLDEKGALKPYYGEIARHQELHCLETFTRNGLRGMYDYWEHIRIEENWIDCPQITHAVYAGNTDGMTVRRNMLHSKEAPLVCADCRKLCVEDNLEKTPP